MIVTFSLLIVNDLIFIIVHFLRKLLILNSYYRLIFLKFSLHACYVIS